VVSHKVSFIRLYTHFVLGSVMLYMVTNIITTNISLVFVWYACIGEDDVMASVATTLTCMCHRRDRSSRPRSSTSMGV
jgi:hypothetical protein